MKRRSGRLFSNIPGWSAVLDNLFLADLLGAMRASPSGVFDLSWSPKMAFSLDVFARALLMFHQGEQDVQAPEP